MWTDKNGRIQLGDGKCRTCRYWGGPAHNRGQTYDACYFDPPAAHSNRAGNNRPMTSHYDFCGRWEHDGEPEAT